MNSLVGRALQILEVLQESKPPHPPPGGEPKIKDEEYGCAKTGLFIIYASLLLFFLSGIASDLTFLYYSNIYILIDRRVMQ